MGLNSYIYLFILFFSSLYGQRLFLKNSNGWGKIGECILFYPTCKKEQYSCKEELMRDGLDGIKLLTQGRVRNTNNDALSFTLEQFKAHFQVSTVTHKQYYTVFS